MVRDDGVGESGGAEWGLGSHPLLTASSSLSTALAAAHGAIDAGSDPSWLAPAEQGLLLESLGRAQASLDALLMRVLPACSGAYSIAEDTAARSAADWLAHRQHVRANRLHAATRLGTALARWPRLAAALAAGDIATDHARAAVEALDRLPRSGPDALDSEVLVKAEAVILGHCREFTPVQIRTLGARLLEAVAPDVAERLEAKRLADEERQARRETTFSMSRTGRGTRRFRGEIGELHAAILERALRAYTNPRRAEADDVVDAERQDGQRLTDSQRLGQAFCALIENLTVDSLPVHGGTPVTVVVTVEEERLREEWAGTGLVDTGTALSPGELRRLCCAHGILPVVLDGASRVLDVGRTQRTFTAAQVTALRATHPECQTRGCDVPAAWCESHHKQPWSTAGPTDLVNGALLCSHHHHRTHDPTYDTRWHPDDTATFHRRC